MRRAALSLFAIAISLFGLSPLAWAHVTVRPAEAQAGAETTYTVRVPTEGQSATTSVEVEVPAGVTIISVAGDPKSYEMKKTGDRVTSIVWKTAIPPEQRAELNFVARNPASGTEITWKAHQYFEDGTHAAWVEAKGSKRPASLTALKAP
ncbi:MAG: DUF1775 domain-containing protein [Rhodospirillaceae bacterium]